jgi:hypothetical protein
MNSIVPVTTCRRLLLYIVIVNDGRQIKINEATEPVIIWRSKNGHGID